MNFFWDTSNTLAYAYSCALEPGSNRPILGAIYLNLNYFDYTTTNMQDNLYIVMHEFFHALGFSPYLFKYYINPKTGNQIPTS